MGMGGGVEVLKYFVREGQNFFYLLCVCVGGVRFSTSPSVKKKKKKPDPPHINK